MIGYAWSTDVPTDTADEVDELLAEAVEYDAEAGFSTADPRRSPAAGAAVHHLLVTMPPKGSRGSPDLDRLPDVGVVAYLRLEVADGVGDACLVVRPAFRSLGVATLMMERLLAEPEGWTAIDGLTTLRAWSHSAHPAAERMSWRFGAEAPRELFKTLRMIGGRHPYEPVVSTSVDDSGTSGAPELPEGHELGIAPGDRDMRARVDRRLALGEHAVLVGRGVEGEFEAPALVEPTWADEPDKDEVREVLDAALVAAQESGARLASLYVDVDDELVLHVSREAEFFHDQTDRQYRLEL